MSAQPTRPNVATDVQGTRVAVLRFERTPTEGEVIDSWIGELPASTRVTTLPADQLASGLASSAVLDDEDLLVLPVRVAWPAPPEGAGAWWNAVAAVNARVPVARLQRQMLRTGLQRSTVVAGAPASVGELRRRFEQHGGPADSFPQFVHRQAVLTLERAERTAVTGTYKVPQLVVEEVRAGAPFSSGIIRLAQQMGRRRDEVLREANQMLSEMAASHSRVAIDTFNRFGQFLLRAYSVSVDPDQLEALRALNRSHSLVFLPNHRSYLDPFVVRATLLAHGFPANHCFAGNNMAWWPMGEWTRKTGNIILRRSIGDDPVYKFVLRSYLGYLVTKRLNLEWYIEGGRTRTGKLRPPKYGLLTYLIEAVEELETDRDVYLVPISIVYDGLPEVMSLIQEQQGTAKKPESIAWLLNYPRTTGQGFGQVHVCVGDPLSLRRALGPALPAEDTDLEKSSHDRIQARRSRVEKVAFEICHRINRATPVTPSALVTLALLGVDDRALTLSEITDVVAPFIRYFQRRKIAVTGDLGQVADLRYSLDQLTRTGVILRFDDGTEPVWGVSPDRHLEAAFYRNSIVHLVLERSIVELVLQAAADGRITLVEQAWDEAQRLRDLFKFEFFFPDRTEYREALTLELALIDPEWSRHLGDADYARRILSDARPHLAHQALQSFVEMYAVVAERLTAQSPAEAIDPDAFVVECYGVARQRRLQQRVRNSDSISTEVLRTAMRAAAHRDLLGPGGADLAGRRRAFSAELNELLERFRRLGKAPSDDQGGES